MNREHLQQLRRIADEARAAQDPRFGGGEFGLNIDGLRLALRKAADRIDKIIREAL